MWEKGKNGTGETKGKSPVGIGGLDRETGTSGSGRAAAGAKRATGGGPSSAAHDAEQRATDLREGDQGAGLWESLPARVAWACSVGQ